MSKVILITGATGKQGGAVLRSLLTHPSFSPAQYSIYALTRDTSSVSAQRLASRSPAIKLVQGSLDDAPGIFKALPSRPWGVYAVTLVNKKGEAEAGKALVDEAVKAGSSHVVLSSVERGSANDGFNPTNVPHFTTKHEIESHLMSEAQKSNGKLSYTILRPVFFLDNLEMGFFGKIVDTTWRNYVHGKLQVVDTEDIGVLGAKAFLESESTDFKNKAMGVAGDELTFEEANKIFLEKTGQPIPTTFGFLSTLLMWLIHDVKMMFKFFNDPGYQVDIPKLSKLIKVTSFSEWVDKSKFAKKST